MEGGSGPEPAGRRGGLLYSRAWEMGKWAAVLAGGLCVAAAVKEAAPWAAVFAGFACFCGIVARLCQAEEHRCRVAEEKSG